MSQNHVIITKYNTSPCVQSWEKQNNFVWKHQNHSNSRNFHYFWLDWYIIPHLWDSWDTEATKILIRFHSSLRRVKSHEFSVFDYNISKVNVKISRGDELKITSLWVLQDSWREMPNCVLKMLEYDEGHSWILNSTLEVEATSPWLPKDSKCPLRAP